MNIKYFTDSNFSGSAGVAHPIYAARDSRVLPAGGIHLTPARHPEASSDLPYTTSRWCPSGWFVTLRGVVIFPLLVGLQLTACASRPAEMSGESAQEPLVIKATPIPEGGKTTSTESARPRRVVPPRRLFVTDYCEGATVVVVLLPQPGGEPTSWVFPRSLLPEPCESGQVHQLLVAAVPRNGKVERPPAAEGIRGTTLVRVEDHWITTGNKAERVSLPPDLISPRVERVRLWWVPRPEVSETRRKELLELRQSLVGLSTAPSPAAAIP